MQYSSQFCDQRRQCLEPTDIRYFAYVSRTMHDITATIVLSSLQLYTTFLYFFLFTLRTVRLFRTAYISAHFFFCMRADSNFFSTEDKLILLMSVCHADSTVQCSQNIPPMFTDEFTGSIELMMQRRHKQSQQTAEPP
jgi:hypothetical protein